MDGNKYFLEIEKSCPRTMIMAQWTKNYLEKNGYRTGSARESDLIVVFGCEFSSEEREFSLKRLNELIGTGRAGVSVVLTGCLASVDKPSFPDDDNVTVLSHEDMFLFDELIDARHHLSSIPIPNMISKDINRRASYNSRFRGVGYFMGLLQSKRRGKMREWPLNRLLYRFMSYRPDALHERFCMLLSTGCRENCSYCSEKNIFKEYRSRPMETIIEEFRRGLAQGRRTYTLEAFDTGAYGLDIGTNLVSLLRSLQDIAGEEEVQLELLNLHPRYFTRYFKELMECIPRNPRITLIVSPVQSGSDRVLKKMRRPYKVDKFKECALELKRAHPWVRFETHFIVGSPGESDDDFAQSLALLEEIPFSSVMVFKYEKKCGTEAAIDADQVPADVKMQRYRRMWRAALRSHIRNRIFDRNFHNERSTARRAGHGRKNRQI